MEGRKEELTGRLAGSRRSPDWSASEFLACCCLGPRCPEATAAVGFGSRFRWEKGGGNLMAGKERTGEKEGDLGWVVLNWEMGLICFWGRA
jgi:hypothetical protein